MRHELRIADSTRPADAAAWRALSILSLLALAVAACARPPSQEPAEPTEDEAWVSATCLPDPVDTSDWRRYRFADLLISVPAEYTVSQQNPRSIRFSRGTAELALWVSASAFLGTFYSRPARAAQEIVCTASFGGFMSQVTARVDRRIYTLSAVWDGAVLWDPGDWRGSMSASIRTTRLRDATVLRQALHTLRAARDSGR